MSECPQAEDHSAGPAPCGTHDLRDPLLAKFYDSVVVLWRPLAGPAPCGTHPLWASAKFYDSIVVLWRPLRVPHPAGPTSYGPFWPLLAKFYDSVVVLWRPLAGPAPCGTHPLWASAKFYDSMVVLGAPYGSRSLRDPLPTAPFGLF